MNVVKNSEQKMKNQTTRNQHRQFACPLMKNQMNFHSYLNK